MNTEAKVLLAIVVILALYFIYNYSSRESYADIIPDKNYPCNITCATCSEDGTTCNTYAPNPNKSDFPCNSTCKACSGDVCISYNK